MTGKFVKGAWVECECIPGLDDCARIIKKIHASLILNDAIKKAGEEMMKSSAQVMKKVSEMYYLTKMIPPKPYLRPPFSLG